jgi:hypothetical protein
MTLATRDEHRVPSTWLVAALYSVLTVLLTFPLAFHPGSTLVGSDPDYDLFMWTLAWDTHAFTHQPLAIFDANIYFPFRYTLAYSENLIGSAFLAAPLLWLSNNPILALNFVELSSVLLCALGAYVLARRLGLGWSAAFVCGLIYAFAPARFFRIAQIHLTAVQWIPFTLAFLHTYFQTGRRRDLWLACGFFSLQALTTGHGAVFLVLAVLSLIAYRLIRGEPLDAVRRLRDLSLPGLLLLTPAALIVIPYRIVQVEMGLRRILGDLAPTPQSFLASPTHLQTFLLSLIPEARIMERASATLFPGFLTVLLALVAFLPPRMVGNRAATDPSPLRETARYYGVLTVLSLLLASAVIWPYVYWLPGMNFIRVPSRFIILTTLALAVLAAVGTERLLTAGPPLRRRLLAISISSLLILEFLAIPFKLVPYEIRMPAADRWLKGQAQPFVVAEVPVVLRDRYQTMFMFHSMAHWQKTVHGYSGMRPELHERLFRELRTFPDQASLDHLTSLGVTYVVVHIDMYQEPGEWEAVDQRLTQYGSRLHLEFRDNTSRVYSLKR